MAGNCGMEEMVYSIINPSRIADPMTSILTSLVPSIIFFIISSKILYENPFNLLFHFLITFKNEKKGVLSALSPS